MTNPSELCVLVVDDDELQRDILCMQLHELGWPQVLTADSGQAALDIYDRPGMQIGVLICDLSMPEMDGLVLMRHLAQRGARSAILLLSGSEEEILLSAEGLAHAHGLDVRGIMRKPCALEQLTTLMAACQVAHSAKHSPQQLEALSPASLRAALQAGEFVPWYQPKMDILSGKAIGVEALARWNNGTGQNIGPDRFVPAMEAAGLVDELFFQIAQAAARHTAIWRSLGLPCTTAINLSMDTARNLDLPERLGAIMSAAGLLNQDFVIEVTESRLMVERSSTMETLTRLSLLGFTLSIDDFGTGYSSLVQLIDLPFRELKIDGGFVRRADTERKAKAIVQIALLLGAHLQMKVVAEGVETAEQLAQLRHWGATCVQGYLYSRPMPFDACTTWLQAH